MLDGPPRSCLVYDDEHFYMAGLLAEKLALSGHHVTYATPLPSVSTWTDHTLEQDRIVARLNELNVRLEVNARLADGGVLASTLTGAAIPLQCEALIHVGARQSNECALS